MCIIEKLFYEKNEITGSKQISKVNTMVISVFTCMLLFIIISGIIGLMTKSESVREIHTQTLAYNYLPDGSIDEKADYVLKNYAKKNKGSLKPAEYYGWLKDAGVPESNIDVVFNLFDAYDANSNGVLERKEIKKLLYDVENMDRINEDSRTS